MVFYECWSNVDVSATCNLHVPRSMLQPDCGSLRETHGVLLLLIPVLFAPRLYPVCVFHLTHSTNKYDTFVHATICNTIIFVCNCLCSYMCYMKGAVTSIYLLLILMAQCHQCNRQFSLTVFDVTDIPTEQRIVITALA